MEPGAWPSKDEIEELARKTARAHQSRLLPYEARVEAAWDGITEAIASGDEDLSQAARTAINKATRDLQHHHGMPRNNGRPDNGHNGKNFRVFWHVKADPWTFADQIVESVSARQVWAALSPQVRDTLSVYAQTGSVAGTASVMGISYSAASSRLCYARDAAKALWFEGETAPGHWRKAWAGHDIDARQSMRTHRASMRRREKNAAAE